MKKRLLALILAVSLLFGIAAVAFADGEPSAHTLKFNSDGKFTIVHICDIHFHYPMDGFVKQYLIEMVKEVKPDLVVLGGDVCLDSDEQLKAKAIKELCEFFKNNETYFTLTLGNHDNEGLVKEDYFNAFIEQGGSYFLGTDAVPALTGTGTHDLQVKSSDGTKTAFNLFMFDSGSNAYDESGNRLGYDSVHTDQINWYKNRVSALKAENNGQTVPSMAFQHIIVPEIDDALFFETKTKVGALGEDLDNKHYLFTPIPRVHNIKSGVICEKPCPGYYNYGQFDAMKECGDVIAIFSGHDHSNTFTVNVDGIDIVNTGGCKNQAGFRFFTGGVRVITLDEKNPRNYESRMLSFMELGQKEGSKIFDGGEITGYTMFITTVFQKITEIAMFLVHLFA